MFIPVGYTGIVPRKKTSTIGKQNYVEPIYTHMENALNLHRAMGKTINNNPSFKVLYDPYRYKEDIVKEAFEGNCERNSDSSDDGLQVDIRNAHTKHTYETYFQILKTRATSVINFVLDNVAYHPWTSNWSFLKKNVIDKNKLSFEVLDKSDQDIAYVIDKGEKVCFRIHDKTRYMPINIYQYVLYHEMAHMSTHELQHTPKFHQLLNLLSLAAYELGLIDLRRISKRGFYTNDQAILTAESLQDEIIMGCNWMINEHKNNKGLVHYYTELREHVARII